jgi:ribonuclease J
MEGTMLGRIAESCDSEQELEQKIVAAVEKAPGLVLSSVSGQNIDRLVTLFRVAKKTKRVLVIDPYIAHILDMLATFNPSLPHPSVSFQRNLGVYYPLRLCKRMRRDLGMGHVLDQFGAWGVKPEVIKQQPDRYMLLVRDNMAPELDLALKESAHEALFLYGLWKGYWDRPGMQNLQRWVKKEDMQFLYAHTSGHAVTGDLKRLVSALQPKTIVPIHTLCPDDYAAHFDAPVWVAQDGVPIRIG